VCWQRPVEALREIPRATSSLSNGPQLQPAKPSVSFSSPCTSEPTSDSRFPWLWIGYLIGRWCRRSATPTGGSVMGIRNSVDGLSPLLADVYIFAHDLLLLSSLSRCSKVSESDSTTKCKTPLNSTAGGQCTQWGGTGRAWLRLLSTPGSCYFFNLLPVATFHNQPSSTLGKVASTTGGDMDSDGGEERPKMLPRIHGSTHQLEWRIKQSTTHLPIMF